MTGEQDTPNNKGAAPDEGHESQRVELPPTPESKPATEADLKKVQKEMTGFERATLAWTRASFFIVLATAVFIGLQWHEMNVGGKDTHALAEAAKTQAERMKELAERMKDQADYTKTVADQAIVQARASEESSTAMVGANRAWMVPISFSQKVAPIVITFNNAGKSPAINLVGKVEYATMTVLEKTKYDTNTVSPLRDGCEHLQRIQSKTMQSMVAGGGNADFTLGDLPQEWNKPIVVSYGYKILTIHGCLWYQDTLTNQKRRTEFWLQAANFRVRNAPYDQDGAFTSPYLHKGNIFVFH
jgi:hypothetical protein